MQLILPQQDAASQQGEIVTASPAVALDQPVPRVARRVCDRALSDDSSATTLHYLQGRPCGPLNPQTLRHGSRWRPGGTWGRNGNPRRRRARYSPRRLSALHGSAARHRDAARRLAHMVMTAGVRPTHSVLAQRTVRLLRTTSIDHAESLKTHLQQGQVRVFGQPDRFIRSLPQNNFLQDREAHHGTSPARSGQ